MTNIYTKGSCFELYKILKVLWPNAVPYYDGDHIITRIDIEYYDITGKTIPNKNHIVHDMGDHLSGWEDYYDIN